MKLDKKIIIIIVLATLLIITIGFIAVASYNNARYQKDVAIYQQGAQAGYEEAIVQIMKLAPKCEEIPLFVGNETVNLISVDCLKKK